MFLKKQFQTSIQVEEKTIDYDEKVNDRLGEFVEYFVKEFESKLTFYNLIAEGEIKKAGKFSDTFSGKIGQGVGGGLGGLFGYFVGAPQIGVNLGAKLGEFVAEKVGEHVGVDQHRKKVCNIVDLIDVFQKHKNDFRKLLVETGFDIFQSFEIQFMRVTCDEGPKYAMLKLAKDAVNRAVDFISKHPEKIYLSNAVLFGKSKRESAALVMCIPKTPGFDLKYEYKSNKFKWKTASLFKKSGLVVSDKTSFKYYKKADLSCRTDKYGYRRLAALEDWEAVKEKYVEDNIPQNSCEQFTQYHYSLNSKTSSEMCDILLNNLNGKDEKLADVRVRDTLEEVKRDILEEITSLKSQREKLDSEDYDLLKRIETNLRNSSINDYLVKFEEYFEEAKKERQELLNIVEEIKRDVGDIKQNFGTFKSNEKKKQKKKPIRFDISESVISFTGREGQLKEINENIREGTVVINGLPGVGKTELAIKYARSYFSDEDNIIRINSGTHDTAMDSFRRLLKELGFKTKDSDGEQKSLESMAKEAYTCIGGNSLFIFDNAQNYSEKFENCLPIGTSNNPNKIYSLVTSPTAEWTSLRIPIFKLQLGDFSEDESLAFIKLALGIKNNAADAVIRKLAKKLHNFPLALQQAVTYIKYLNEEYAERDSTFNVNDYLKRYEEATRKLLNTKIHNENVQTVINTLEILVDKIKEDKEHGKEALDMLNFMAYLASNNIPEDIFLNQAANGDREKLISVTRLLKKYSIVSLEKSMLSVHGMVQQVVRLDLENTEFERKSMEETILSNLLLLLKDQMADRATAESYIPHITSIWNHAMKYDKLIEQFIVNIMDNAHVYTTYFHLIAGCSNYKVIEKIMSKIDSVKLSKVINSENKEEGSPLHNAVLSGHEQIVKLLVERGANVNAVKENGWTPLLLAAANGYLEVVELLLRYDVDVDAITSQGNTALHFAAGHNYLEIVNALIAKSADVSAETVDNYTPLHVAAENGNLNIVNILIRHNAFVNAKTDHEFTPLHLAAKKSHFDVVSVLLAEGAEVNYETRDKFTALHFAAQNANLEIVNILLSQGATVNSETTHGNTPLHLSVKSECLVVISSLLANGANSDIHDTNSFTPLHWAALKGNVEIADLLLKDGSAGVNLPTNKGNTALHLAAEQGHYKTVEVLLSHKANADIKNNEGNTAYDLAHAKKRQLVKNCITAHLEKDRKCQL